jgi:DNA-binding response OmpR family regulator
MSAGSKTVLIIDDEEDLCYLLANLLRAQGFVVQTEFTLAAGLAAIRRQPSDWVILDNDLPDGQGWEKLEEFRAMAPHSGFIMISANPDAILSELLEKVHYLMKPIHVNSIISLIRAAI